ncbi:MAG: RIP metalloprotease RseP [Nitrospira bacterium HGW-Nitrospira-1]|nr:MAG: RIP metalloprotease RseP [Nitrospira bacterium HGW-Nitrospira-1]
MIIIYAVVLLGVLIFVHEAGHFLLAKLLGVKVLKFSLGFGPKIIGWKFGETEYLLSAVPLGGYVKMLGEEPGEELDESEKNRAYNYQPVWKRFAIVFSGPFFNLLFAAKVFVLIFLLGVPLPLSDIGKVQENSPAAAAGLLTGDRVVQINGKAVESWLDILTILNDNPGKTLLFKIKRNGRVFDIPVRPEKKADKNIFGEDKEVWSIGIEPLLFPVVGEVMKGLRADEAGLLKGDRIIEISGTTLKTWQDMTMLIHASPEKPLRFRIQRGGQVMDMTITPRKETYKTPDGDEKSIGLIGIKPAGNDFIKKYGLPEAVSLGLKRTWDISVLTVVSMVKLIQRVIPSNTIGGPIMIFQMAGEQASQGALNFFTFMAVISINLGILNLLPIPILDGGHILFLGIETIRRRPLSKNVVMIAQRAGLVFLLTLMAFAFYNDIVRLFAGKMF